MNTSKKLSIALTIGISLAGCASQRPLFKAPMVSTTDSSVETPGHLEDLGPVTARYCPGDPPQDPTNKNIGMLDEVIGKAQSSVNARYIKDAQFYTAGNCVYLEGTALR